MAMLNQSQRANLDQLKRAKVQCRIFVIDEKDGHYVLCTMHILCIIIIHTHAHTLSSNND